MVNIRYLFSIIISLTAAVQASAQYTFQMASHSTGDCTVYDNLGGGLEDAISDKIAQAVASFFSGRIFNTWGECDAARAYYQNQVFNNTARCRVWTTTSPCVRIGAASIADGSAVADMTGIDRGAPSFNVNPAKEIEQWEAEFRKKMEALYGKDWESKLKNGSGSFPLTGDVDFDALMARYQSETANEIGQWTIIPPSMSSRHVFEDDGTLEAFLKSGRKFRSINLDEMGGVSTHSDDYAEYDRIIETAWADSPAQAEKQHPYFDWVVEGLKIIPGILTTTIGAAEVALIEANLNLIREIAKCIHDKCVSSNEIFKKAWNIDFANGVIWGIDLRAVNNVSKERTEGKSGLSKKIAEITTGNPLYIVSEGMYYRFFHNDDSVVKDNSIINYVAKKGVDKMVRKGIWWGSGKYVESFKDISTEGTARLNYALKLESRGAFAWGGAKVGYWAQSHPDLSGTKSKGAEK